MKRSMTHTSLILIAGLLGLGGCASFPDPNYAPMAPVSEMPPAPMNGSIYQAGTSLVLFEDMRARRIGDTLTIVLSESTNASKKSSTSTSKQNEIALANPTLLGSSVTFDTNGGVLSGLPLSSRTANTMEVGINTDQGFDGGGSTAQSNTLSGSITVTVSEVLSNGNLVVRGEKWLKLDQGNEYVRIKGIVRPVDISGDNTVLSAKVAHAQISYGGSGSISDASKHGWLSRFFLKFWPF